MAKPALREVPANDAAEPDVVSPPLYRSAGAVWLAVLLITPAIAAVLVWVLARTE